MRSMTGFGKGSAVMADGTCCTLELSSVNRKQLEMRFSMPVELSFWEPEARKRISAAISRGALQLRVGMVYPAAGLQDLDRGRLDALVALCREYSDTVDVASLLSLPGVLGSGTAGDSAENAVPMLNMALEQALTGFRAMREREGAALETELRNRLNGLRELLGRIEPFTAGLAAAAKAKILARLAEEKIPCDVNDERFQRELLFYADKADVTEEITRLKSHFAQFENFLAVSGEPAGRSMDFLIQEMFREITTLGNKAGTSDVSPMVVKFKTELEKMREQVQNVE